MVDFREPPRVFSLSRLLLGALVIANVVVLALVFLRDPEPVAGGTKRAAPTPDGALTLLGELSEDGRAGLDDMEAAREPPQPTPAQAPGLDCKVWGPFAGDAALAAARTAVEAVAERVEVVRSPVAAPPDFLVYIDTDNNLDNARRLLQELESQDIDAYVIAGGRYVNSVSAGVFSNRDGAARLMTQLKDLGYKPRLEPLEREQDVQLLVARVPPGFELDDLASRPCREIASQEDFL